jgi:hypothetical protein
VLILALKLALPPALIAGASVAGRRWGPGFSGWMVALPLVSGPTVFFLALDQGTSFAAATAHGTLTGVAGQAGFCVAYGWSGRVCRWPAALASGALGFAMGALALGTAAQLPLATLLVLVAGCVALALRAMPAPLVGTAPVSLGRWDIPWRMATGTVAVVTLTRAAPLLGPRFSGVLAAFPVVTAVLAVFAQRAQGPRHANAVLRGLLLGMFSFVAFYAVLEIAVERAGIAGGFAAASGAALLVQALTAVVHRAVGPRVKSS